MSFVGLKKFETRKIEGRTWQKDASEILPQVFTQIAILFPYDRSNSYDIITPVN